ncbi:hypothetical protein Tco_0363100 [Tanacetum coccineum]
MRPFGCPVTTTHTIDHLGKFDGKADEGFFVGYSVNNKAFRVKLEWRQYLAKITFCYHCGMLIHHSLKVQRVLLMLDSNLQEMMKRRLLKKTVKEVNVVGAKTSIELPDDPNMPELEDIVYSDDDENVGADG